MCSINVTVSKPTFMITGRANSNASILQRLLVKEPQKYQKGKQPQRGIIAWGVVPSTEFALPLALDNLHPLSAFEQSEGQTPAP